MHPRASKYPLHVLFIKVHVHEAVHEKKVYVHIHETVYESS